MSDTKLVFNSNEDMVFIERYQKAFNERRSIFYNRVEYLIDGIESGSGYAIIDAFGDAKIIESSDQNMGFIISLTPTGNL